MTCVLMLNQGDGILDYLVLDGMVSREGEGKFRNSNFLSFDSDSKTFTTADKFSETRRSDQIPKTDSFDQSTKDENIIKERID